MDNKLDCTFSNNGYLNFYNYMNECDMNSFKQNNNLNYMTEHLGNAYVRFGHNWYDEILKLNMIDTIFLVYLLNLNDRIGNPWLCNIHNISCSPNSLKYVYFGLLTIRYMLDKNMDNFNFIEIGGGYGGQCIILLELFKKFNIHYGKYIIIDLDNVNHFQKKYVEMNNMHDKCEFVNYEKYKEYPFSGGNNFLFSSYALSEISEGARLDYYTHLLPLITNGFIVWNTKTIDFPLRYTAQKEVPLTGPHNLFLYF